MSTNRIRYSALESLFYLPGPKVEVETNKDRSYLLFFPISLLEYFRVSLIENATIKDAWKTYHINSSSITVEKVSNYYHHQIIIFF
jgi:hypothetical protein